MEQVDVGPCGAPQIPDGQLYVCPFTIAAGAGVGTYALSYAASASDLACSPIPSVTSVAGEVIVTTCTGDCNGNDVVSIGEVVKCVNHFLGEPFCNATNASLGCTVADANLDGVVSIGEVVQCINRFLNGCP
jgi:hypothetical protein